MENIDDCSVSVNFQEDLLSQVAKNVHNSLD